MHVDVFTRTGNVEQIYFKLNNFIFFLHARCYIVRLGAFKAMTFLPYEI
jgi:hypothetical protein